MITALQAVVQGIVEGITEFLPISSTGHLIVSGAAMGMPDDHSTKTFEIAIQFGAIVAVMLYYRTELLQQFSKVASEPKVRRFFLNLFIAFLPVAVVGLLAHHWVEEHLLSSKVVATTFIVGGIILILTDRRGAPEQSSVSGIYDLMPRHALAIGIAQIFSLIPGVSRSGSTIVGGMLAGLDRETATRFSFFLAIPTLGTATLYSAYKARHEIVAGGNLMPFAIGTVVSFVVALLAIGWLLRFVANHSFFGFGVYRIIAGIVVLALLFSGFLPH